jgi:triphosphoribosyl-dephospho-CoA synthase
MMTKAMDDTARCEAAFVDACLLDVLAFKPGNVGIHGAGHRLEARDFVRSARAASGPLCAPELTLGQRIAGAVEATHHAVATNTNLGIVLLAAPLVHAAHRASRDRLRFMDALRMVLEETTVDDANRAFRAIRLANPGGLGDASQHDVRSEAVTTLRTAMAKAAHRDSIALQYASGFEAVVATGLDALRHARAAGSDWRSATQWLFLAYLARYPDSHVRRKLGESQALALRDEAALRVQCGFGAIRSAASRRSLVAWDRSLKAEGINPGTTADLTVATLLLARLDPSSGIPT